MNSSNLSDLPFDSVDSFLVSDAEVDVPVAENGDGYDPNAPSADVTDGREVLAIQTADAKNSVIIADKARAADLFQAQQTAEVVLDINGMKIAFENMQANVPNLGKLLKAEELIADANSAFAQRRLALNNGEA